MPFFTLTSDIGSKDYLVGAAKGLIWQQHPQAQITDISHDITPFNYNEAAYYISSAFPHFPAFTWHVMLVNLFDAPVPRCLLAFHAGMYFVAPDNGLLPMVLDGMPDLVVELPLGEKERPNMLAWIRQVAAAAAKVDQGRPIIEVGPEVEELVQKHRIRPIIGPDHIDGRVVLIDRYENVIFNITQQEFESARKGRSFEIRFKGNEVITRLALHYGDVPEGDKLAFFNTAGYLEIAVNKGNAAGLFGLQALDAPASQQFQQSRLLYHTVRIFFR